MRLLIDTLVALMLAGLLAGVVAYRHQDRLGKEDRASARAELKRFQRQILLESALGPVQMDEHPYPDVVDPEWFDGRPPENPLLGPMHPWVEIAGRAERNLMHPMVRASNDPNVARFWYNPKLGLVRARVPLDLSERAALELYNFVNDADLRDLYSLEQTVER